MEARKSCQWCGAPKVYAKGRCRACYEFQKGTGEERSEDVIQREIEREVAGWQPFGNQKG